MKRLLALQSRRPIVPSGSGALLAFFGGGIAATAFWVSMLSPVREPATPAPPAERVPSIRAMSLSDLGTHPSPGITVAAAQPGRAASPAPASATAAPQALTTSSDAAPQPAWDVPIQPLAPIALAGALPAGEASEPMLPTPAAILVPVPRAFDGAAAGGSGHPNPEE